MISLSRLKKLAQEEIYETVCQKVDRIRDIRLEELDIDWDEYKASYENTDYDTVITICEEILEELLDNNGAYGEY